MNEAANDSRVENEVGRSQRHILGQSERGSSNGVHVESGRERDTG